MEGAKLHRAKHLARKRYIKSPPEPSAVSVWTGGLCGGLPEILSDVGG